MDDELQKELDKGRLLKEREGIKEEQLIAKLTDTVSYDDMKQAIGKSKDEVYSGPSLKLKKFSSLTKDEQKAEEAHYEEVKARNTFVKASELNTPYMLKVLSEKKKIDGKEITQEELLNKVRQGDCSHMQQLDPVLRNRAATEYLIAHPIKQSPEDFVESLKKERYPMAAMMNPLLRMSISLVIHSKDVDDAMIEKYKKIDELLNKEIMMATITKRKCMVHDFYEEDKDRNVRSQVFIMKTLLTTHVGRLQEKKKNGNPPSKDWSGSVANAFAHCSRVTFTLPQDPNGFNAEAESNMNRYLWEKDGFFKRGGATHNLVQKRRFSNQDAVEKSQFTPFNQHGMNIAVGGLGNFGIPKGKEQRKLKNDGSCGHLFMHFEKGDKEKHSGMLIGFESDAYGVMNQTGHVHDLAATGEFQSSFGGQRCDEIGEKYGGRVADLSDVDIYAYTELMALMDTVATNLLMAPRDDAEFVDANHEMAQLELNDLAEQLCGDLMGEAQMKSFISRLYRMANIARSDEKADDMYKRLYRIG